MRLMTIVAVAASMVAVACSSHAPLATHAISNAGGLAFEGTLHVMSSCVWLTTEGAAFNLIWPRDFSLRGPPLEIHGPRSLILVDGDRVLLGATPPEPGVVAGCPFGTVSYVGEVAEVNGVRIPGVPPPTERPGRNPR